MLMGAIGPGDARARAILSVGSMSVVSASDSCSSGCMARSVSTTRMTLRASPSISHSNHVRVICRAASRSPDMALTGLGRARADFPLDESVARIAQGGDCDRAAAQFGAFAIQEGQREIGRAHV